MQPSKGQRKVERLTGQRPDQPLGESLGDEAVLPTDLVSLDQLLSSLPHTAFGATEPPVGLAGRVFEASRSLLPIPVVARIGPAASARLRWARIAVAAAVTLAAAVGSLIFMKTGGVDINALARAREAPRSPESQGLPEATLVALLQPEFADDQSFTSSAGRAVAPVLQTRGVRIEDFASELEGMLGGDDSHSM